jgi:hypothetical protein
VTFARDAGYRRLRLWTNDVLTSARHIYLAAGFRMVTEKPNHSFGVDVGEQDYELELCPA